MKYRNQNHISFSSVNRPFVWLLLPLVLGILSQYYLSAALPPQILWMLLFLMLALSAVCHFLKSSQYIISLLRTLSLLTVVFCFGILLSHYQDIRQQQNWYGHYLKQSQAVQVEILSTPERKTRTLYLPTRVTAMKIDSQWMEVSGSLKLYVYLNDSLPEFLVGSKLLLPNKLIPIKNSGNPFNFDYAAYAARQGWYHQTFLAAKDVVLLGGYKPVKPFLTKSISAAMFQYIQENIPDSTTQSLVAAVLLNERSLMDNELWQAYAATGIVHIIAISGMHVVLLFTVLQFLLSWIRNKRLTWLKYLLALPLVWLYIAITNFPPSAVRAGTMFTLVAIGILVSRKGDSINTWAATALLMLCYNPYWLFNIGVQLSFLAVLSILLFYRPINRWYFPPNKIIKFLWNSFSVSLAAQILIFPLVIFYFHQFPLWVLLVNIPAALYSFVLMVGALLLCTLAALGIPCLWLGSLLTVCTTVFHEIILFFAHYTPNSLRSLFIDSVDFWLLTIVVLLLCYSLMRRKTWAFSAALFGSILIVLSLILQDWQALHQKRLVVYNVSKMSLADIYEDKKVYPINYQPDSITEKTWQYVLLPARLGYRSMKLQQPKHSKVEMIGAKKVFFLNKSYRAKHATLSFPVDYLVVGNDCQYQPEIWLGVFRPGKIILDGSLPRWKAKKWTEGLAHYKVPVHWVQEDGAFIVALY